MIVVFHDATLTLENSIDFISLILYNNMYNIIKREEMLC